MRVVVTAGYSQSLHAVALIHRLADRGHEVALALNVRILNPMRLRYYVRQLGWRTFWRKMSNRLSGGRGRGTVRAETAPMQQYLSAHNIASRTIPQAARAVGARHLRVNALNDARALDALRAAQPDVIVYAGGGILRKGFLSIPRYGVLNAHGGPLPQFRGMNAVEWPMFHGVKPAITVHFVDTGIDTGAIVMQRPVIVDVWTDVFAERGQTTVVAVEALTETVDLIAAGTITSTPQDPAAGRQFFVMAPPLIEVLQRWIAAGRTPAIDPADFTFPAACTPPLAASRPA